MLNITLYSIPTPGMRWEGRGGGALKAALVTDRVKAWNTSTSVSIQSRKG